MLCCQSIECCGRVVKGKRFIWIVPERFLSSLCFKLHWWNIIEDLGEGEAGELVRGFKPVSEKYTH